MTEVVVRRPAGFYQDRLRTYRILVDGVERARVRRNGTARFDVTPGVRRFEARIDWTGSELVEIDAVDGRPIHLEVRPAPMTLTSMFRRVGYLDLRVAKG